TQLEKKLQDRQQDLEVLEKQYRDLEQAINDLERGEIQQHELLKHVREAKEELALLAKEREHSQVRRQQHLEARRDVQAAEERLRAVQARWQQFVEARSRWQSHQTELTRLEAEAKAAQEKQKQLELAYQSHADALTAARQAEESHNRSREEIDDRRKLLDLATRGVSLQKTLQRLVLLEQEGKRRTDQMRSCPAPDKVELEKLRTNRRQAQSLSAQLQAAGLVLTVAPTQPVKLRVSRDGQPAEEVDVAPGENRTWPLRQRVQIEAPGLGAIEVARRQENADLERSVRQLAELNRLFAERIEAYQEQPKDEGGLDGLADRLFQQEGWLRELEQLRREVDELAPQGVGAKQNERLQLERERRILLQCRPQLTAWQPSAPECEQLAAVFQARGRELERQR